MKQSDKFLQGLRAAIAIELKQEAAGEAQATQRQLVQLRQKVAKLTASRDRHRARSAELRSYIAKYQRELAELKAKQ